MKKMGDIYTVKGKGLQGTVEKIALFDGRFDTAYKLLKIEIGNTDPYVNEEISFKVKLEEGTAGTAWNWGSNIQIGWAALNTPIESRFGYLSFVDPDNLIVEDVFIDFGSPSSTAEINYMLTFQKYDISEWKGALAMVRNKAQGAD
jgi:hypothetical protein